MKNLFLFLIFILGFYTNAQNKITFGYDADGNQSQRLLCQNCSSKQKLEPKKMIIEDAIVYYPNPVNEELNLSWGLRQNNVVSEIQLYGINGQLLKTFVDSKNNSSQIISFQQYPIGVYLIVLKYGDGGQKTIKIIKNK